MNFSLLTQVGLIAITVFIAITYIKPTIGEIDALQNNIFEYKQTVMQAIELNDVLSKLVQQANSISIDDNKALFRYMPDVVDSISISKDLELIAEESGLLLSDVEPVEQVTVRVRPDAQLQDEDDRLFETTSFAISAVGDYQQLKEFLQLLAINDYPLFVTSVSINDGGGDSPVLEFEVTVETYSLLPESVDEN